MVAATEARFAGPLRHNPANPRYFTDGSGKAIYLTGSHTWAVMQDIWLETGPRRNTDYAGFLDMLQDNGHNFLRFWTWLHPRKSPWATIDTCFDPLPYARTGPGLARDGLPRFDLTRWNEAYFERLRERVLDAARRGIYVSVMFFEAWTIKMSTPAQDPWLFHPMHADNNVNGVTDDPVGENGRAWDVFSLNCPQLLHWQETLVKKMVDTVSDLDNVLFEICNEVPHRPEAMTWQEHLCRVVHEYQRDHPKQHPVGITPEGGSHNNAELLDTSADWISSSNGSAFEYRYNPPAADGRKVILTDTDHLWGHGAEVAWIWKSFTRGLNVLFMDPWEPIPTDLARWTQDGVSLNQRYYHLWDPVRRNLGYTRHLAERLYLNACLPHPELCTSTYCLAHPGHEYVCYFPAGGHEGLDLHQAPGAFAVEWLNPSSGATYSANPIKGGTRHALRAPFDGPAVLYLRKQPPA